MPIRRSRDCAVQHPTVHRIASAASLLGVEYRQNLHHSNMKTNLHVAAVKEMAVVAGLLLGVIIVSETQM